MLCHSKRGHILHHQHPTLHPRLPPSRPTLPPSPSPLLLSDLDRGGLHGLSPLYLLRQINSALSDRCELWCGPGYNWNTGYLLPGSGLQLTSSSKNKLNYFSHHYTSINQLLSPSPTLLFIKLHITYHLLSHCYNHHLISYSYLLPITNSPFYWSSYIAAPQVIFYHSRSVPHALTIMIDHLTHFSYRFTRSVILLYSSLINFYILPYYCHHLSSIMPICFKCSSSDLLFLLIQPHNVMQLLL